MEKWGLAICGLGLFLIMISSASTPANFLMVASGIFYVGLGSALIIYHKKRGKK